MAIKVLILFAMMHIEVTLPDTQEMMVEAEVSQGRDTVLAWERAASYIEEIETHDVLAIIHVESGGDPNARRPNSRFHGILQISDAYMDDALSYAGKRVAPASSLMGEGKKSLKIFHLYMKRYAGLHGWVPENIALLHKAGPTGLARILRRKRNKNLTLKDSTCADATVGACEYLRRFREARSLYHNPTFEGSKALSRL